MAIIDFLFSLPLWLLATVLNAWMIGFALVGQWIVRRCVQPRLKLDYDDAEYASAMVQSGMLLYGLIAALTAVGVWQKYTEVSAVISAEATAIGSLWRDLDGYPQPLHDSSRDILRGYTEQIIERAWPQLRRGEIPREGVEWMDRLQKLIFAFEPATEGQKVLHAEALHAFNNLILQRRLRLDSVHTALPGVMWAVLLPGAMGCIVLCLFFHVRSPRFQAVLLAALSGFLAMVLFVIFALDRPFQGDLGIDAGAYQLIYDHYMRK